MKVVFSNQAERDLEEIGDLIALDNPSKAVSFVQDLRESCKKIESFPSIGVERAELEPDSRMLVHKKYLIFYYIADNKAIVDRFLHGSRDIEAVFEERKQSKSNFLPPPMPPKNQ